MERRYSPEQVAKLFGVTKGTVIGWCQDGTMPAVNVARASAKRKRWRMSQDDIAAFEARRQNKPE
ncbi:MAG: helix-turn-helix domain-containing protein, partial [Planctomycetota bacterium]|nr:helix-turn-helix domain-containing protein [Planctomycetota bacterium]